MVGDEGDGVVPIRVHDPDVAVEGVGDLVALAVVDGRVAQPDVLHGGLGPLVDGGEQLGRAAGQRDEGHVLGAVGFGEPGQVVGAASGGGGEPDRLGGAAIYF